MMQHFTGKSPLNVQIILWTVMLVLEAVYWIYLYDEYYKNENLLLWPHLSEVTYLFWESSYLFLTTADIGNT